METTGLRGSLVSRRTSFTSFTAEVPPGRGIPSRPVAHRYFPGYLTGVTRNRGLLLVTDEKIAFHFALRKRCAGHNTIRIKTSLSSYGMFALKRKRTEGGDMTTSKRTDVDDHVAIFHDRPSGPEPPDRDRLVGHMYCIYKHFHASRVMMRTPVRDSHSYSPNDTTSKDFSMAGERPRSRVTPTEKCPEVPMAYLGQSGAHPCRARSHPGGDL